MNILVFDTCLDKMYLALASDDKILESKIVENRDNKYHSAFLISTIRQILQDNNLTPDDIDILGTNIGPGSFTGIRACTTVARVMAQQLNIPVVGVSSLEILACINNTDKKEIVAIDARKNSAYLYLNKKIQGAIQLEQIKEELTKEDYYIITDDKLQPIFGGNSYQNKDYPLGEYLAKLVYEKYTKDKNNFEWQKLKPLYIQPPPVFNK